MAQTKHFNPEFIDVYQNRNYAYSGNPIRVGGSDDNTTYIKVPKAALDAIRSSKTTAKLYLRMYIATWGGEIDIGYHRETRSRAYTRGQPWYAYNETYRSGGNGWWVNYDMSNWFKTNLLNGNTQGVVLYNTRQQYSVISDTSDRKMTFMVEGEWNTPPGMPSELTVSHSGNPDTWMEFYWPHASDAEQSSSELKYDIEFDTGKGYKRIATGFSGTLLYHSLNQYPTSPRVQARIRTYDGQAYSSWRYSGAFQITHKPPVFSANQVSYLDTRSAITAITGDNQIIVQGESDLRISINSAAIANDTKTISKYVVSVAGKELERTSIGDFNFGRINASTNQTVTIRAIDSEGYSTSVTKTIKVVPYEKPQLVYSANRLGSISNETLIEANGSISPLNINGSNKNSLQNLRYRSRAEDGSTGWSGYRSFNFTQSGNSFDSTDVTELFDAGKSWQIEFTAIDKIGSTIVVTVLNRGTPIFFIDEMLESISLGKMPTEPKTADFDGKLKAHFLEVTKAPPTASFNYESGWWNNGQRTITKITNQLAFIEIACAGGTMTYGTRIFTLPDGFRPVRTIQIQITARGYGQTLQDKPAYIQIEPNGEGSIYGVQHNSYLYGYGVYVLQGV